LKCPRAFSTAKGIAGLGLMPASWRSAIAATAKLTMAITKWPIRLAKVNPFDNSPIPSFVAYYWIPDDSLFRLIDGFGPTEMRD
jgi:hypothetical protein